MSERTPAEILWAARERIADPANWSATGWGSSEGKCCALRAVFLAEGGGALNVLRTSPARNILEGLAGTYIGDFSDSHTHGEVLDLFDRAIELAKDQS